MSATLRLDALSKTFDGANHAAVDDVSFTVAAGECLAILGPSGSGKSTVLRSIAGLDVPSSGRILVDGTDVAGLAPERRGMAMVFQRPLLFPHLSVLDNVAFAGVVGGQPKREARADAAQFLDLVQLGGFGTRPVTALSGGQEQRVALARALAARPRVLLLDEPFSALDPALRSDMHELLAQIRAQLSPTVVMVTHDRDEAAVVADRVALLTAGRLLQHDTVARLYARPQSLAVARLMGGRNEIAGTVTEGRHHSALGAIAAPDGEQWPDGDAVLVVRQEALRLGEPSPGETGVRGRVARSALRGPRSHVVVDVADARLELETAAISAPEVGAEVTVSIPHAGCAVLAA